MRVAIYLRKSRADEEAERLGQGETLSKHRKALLRYAKEKGHNIIKIYEELVSGEELFFRPSMLELLKDLESGLYDGVLVMDMQRLGRGDAEEQGLILKTFKKTAVKIITPQKIYDLANEFDEDYAEFETFMSRKEYRMITRRMQGGRARSVQDGNWIATLPPYGYLIKEDKQGRYLIPHPEQAPVVRMIFELYISGLGFNKIAHKLNELGIPSYTGQKWERTAAGTIIKNPVYIGKVCWKKRCIRKSKEPGKKKDAYTRNKDEWIIAKGKHEAIVPKALYDKAQETLDKKYHVPYQLANSISNPLAGLAYCKLCGKALTRRPYNNKAPHLVCTTLNCKNKSSRLDLVEVEIIKFLTEQIKSENINSHINSNDNIKIESLQNSLDIAKRNLESLEKQKLKLYDLLEQGVYDVSVFTERSKLLNERIESSKLGIKDLENQITATKNAIRNINNFIPKVKKLVEMYNTMDVESKNVALKSIIGRIDYYKPKDKRNGDFELDVQLGV